jgi:zinc protease
MRAASAALAKILKDGVTQAELDRASADMESIFAAAATDGPTTPSHTLADSLLHAVDDEASFLTPEQSAAFYRAEIKNLDASEVTTALRDAFSGTGPFVLVSGSRAPTGGRTAITEALAAVPTSETDSQTASLQKAITKWPRSQTCDLRRAQRALRDSIRRRAISDAGRRVRTLRHDNTQGL